MRTPKEYTKNVQNHIITAQMLSDCLYSCNKRAKNWRDKESYYRSMRYDTYHNEENARAEKEAYYYQKEKLLSIVNPVCVHRETIQKTWRERIYEYEDEYWMYKEQGEFVHENGYYDNEMHEYVEFGDIEVSGEIQKFYIFYDLGCGHTFHTPLCDDEEEEIAQNYARKHNLQIIDIGRLITYGDKIDDLISTQFVKKVLSLIESEEFTFIEATPESEGDDVTNVA